MNLYAHLTWVGANLAVAIYRSEQYQFQGWISPTAKKVPRRISDFSKLAFRGGTLRKPNTRGTLNEVQISFENWVRNMVTSENLTTLPNTNIWVHGIPLDDPALQTFFCPHGLFSGVDLTVKKFPCSQCDRFIKFKHRKALTCRTAKQMATIHGSMVE